MAQHVKKNVATQSKANIFVDPESYDDETVEIARGTCEHSEYAWLEPSYALVGSGATLKEVV